LETEQPTSLSVLDKLANNLSSLYEDLFTLMLDPLRANSVTPRLLTSEYSALAAQKGQKISVPLTSAMTVGDVTPGVTPPTPADMTPSGVDVEMANWKYVTFQLSDKDKFDVRDGNMPKVLSKAMSTLVDAIDTSILTAASQGAGSATGTAGTSPFASAILAVQANKILNRNKVDKAGRHVMFDADAEANLLALPEFANSQFVGDYQAMTNGTFDGNRRVGSQWWQNQNIVTHTKGVGSGYVTNGSQAAGATSIVVQTGTGALVAGDVISFAADTANKYVVAEAYTGGAGTVTINSPGLVNTIPTGNAITVNNDHVANIAFSSDSIAFASRPLPASDANAMTDTLVDPVSGLAVRLETMRGWMQDLWVVSALWGVKAVRSEGIVKILG